MIWIQEALLGITTEIWTATPETQEKWIVILEIWNAILETWTLEIWTATLEIWTATLEIWTDILEIWTAILEIWTDILETWTDILEKWTNILETWTLGTWIVAPEIWIVVETLNMPTEITERNEKQRIVKVMGDMNPKKRPWMMGKIFVAAGNLDIHKVLTKHIQATNAMLL
jgi:hypothetical protein